MSEQPVQKERLLTNPQFIVAIFGAVTTVIAAFIGVLPNVIEASRPPTATPTPIIITATSIALVATEASTLIQPSFRSDETTTDVVEIVAVASATTLPTATEVIPPTATEIILPTVTEVMPSANITLIWDTDSFTVLNATGQKMSLEGITFQSSNGAWQASQWGNTIYNALPSGKCVRLRDASVGNRQPPTPCVNNIYGLMQVGRAAFFWKNVASFDVLLNSTIMTTCEIAAGTCGIYVAP